MAATGALVVAATATVIVLPLEDAPVASPVEPPVAVGGLTPPEPDPAPVMRPVAVTGVARAAAVPTGVRMTPMQNWRRGAWYRWTSRVERFARCVAKHESWHAGLWHAENPVSTASGAFQMIDGTYRVMARRAHVPNRGHASRATPREQARIMAWAVKHHQRRHWHGTGCVGT